jgi:Zn-dependent M28 family amino/carboxypeptidase
MNSSIILKTLPIFLLAALFQGCAEKPADVPEPEPAVEPAPEQVSTQETQRLQIEADIHKHTAVLASDEFEGRAPASAGETLTIEYLKQQFMDLGLEPGNGEDWFQEVPVTSVTTAPTAVLTVAGQEFKRELAYDAEMMVFTQQQVESVTVENSPMVFVGYGINAPERDWNDYAGIDVTGKTVVMLVNDPGFATQDEALFNGNTMTYYGRWDYKYEEAARQGATAAIIVHETAPAAYPWEVVTGSWSGPQIGITAQNKNMDKLEVEAWVTLEVAEELFAAAKLDYQALKTAAAGPGFTAVPMGDLAASITLENTSESSLSRNVVARLPGTTHPDEHIVYSAHWDHLGRKPGADGEDDIYNGAVDNATGTAGLLALARLHMQQGPAQRSILFLSVTAEEAGLLGSKWYAENPIYPVETTVANLNMDALHDGGRMRDVAVVGYGNSELDSYLKIEAEAQDRVLVQEPTPEKGYYYRSDHFNFARQGVPALYLTNSTDSREFGKTWGQNQLDAFVSNKYHKPSDEYSEDWDLSGPAETIQLFYGVGSSLANSRDWPNWNEGVEFKRKRDETSAARDQ